MKACKSHIKLHKHTFELIGYDFMLIPGQQESPFEVRLIEVNTNPCIEEPNTLLKQYVPRMLDDMLKIVLDPLFSEVEINKVTPQQQQSGFPVDGVPNNENMWTKIFQI
jgi:hypothetical protein